MSAQLAYVKFKDRVRAVVEIDDVVDFYPRHSSDFDPQRTNYAVKWKMLGGEIKECLASILCLSASREDLIAKVDDLKLPKLPPSFLNETEPIDDVPDSASDLLERSSRGRKRTRDVVDKSVRGRTHKLLALARQTMAVSENKSGKSKDNKNDSVHAPEKNKKTSNGQNKIELEVPNQPEASAEGPQEKPATEKKTKNSRATKETAKRNLLKYDEFSGSCSGSDDQDDVLVPRTELKLLETENANLILRMKVLEERRAKAVEALLKQEEENTSLNKQIKDLEKSLRETEARSAKWQDIVLARSFGNSSHSKEEKKDGGSSPFDGRVDNFYHLDNSFQFENEKGSQYISTPTTDKDVDLSFVSSTPNKNYKLNDSLIKLKQRTPAKKHKIDGPAIQGTPSKQRTPLRRSPRKKTPSKSKDMDTSFMACGESSQKPSKGHDRKQWSVSKTRIESIANTLLPELQNSTSALPMAEGKVSISSAVRVTSDVWDTIRKCKTESLMVTSALRSIWGRRVLAQRSLKGQATNRKKDCAPKPPLSPKKVEVVYGLYRASLMKDGVTSDPKLMDLVIKNGTKMIQNKLAEEDRWWKQEQAKKQAEVTAKTPKHNATASTPNQDDDVQTHSCSEEEENDVKDKEEIVGVAA